MVTSCLHLPSVQLGQNRSSFTLCCLSTFYQAIKCIPLLIGLHMLEFHLHLLLAVHFSSYACSLCCHHIGSCQLARVSLCNCLFSFSCLILCNRLFISYTFWKFLLGVAVREGEIPPPSNGDHGDLCKGITMNACL